MFIYFYYYSFISWQNKEDLVFNGATTKKG